MRFEEVVVFTCGLMKDPTALIHHNCNKFNKMNTSYLGRYTRVPDEKKESDLKRFGKIAVNLDFFLLVWAESRIPLPWTPLQNPYFNWFDHERDDQHGLARDKSSVCIPSEYYSFQNLKKPISSHNIQEHGQFGQCSIVIDNPHPDVVDSLLLTCSTICKHQPVANLCLFNLRIKSTAIDNIFKLSPNAEFLVVEDCILPLNMMSCLFQQISVCSTLGGIRLENTTFEEPGKSLIHLSEAIRTWGDNNDLEYLVIVNCSLLLDQWSSILQSLSTCKYLINLNLSNNVVGSGGKHLAESIRNWGINPPLQYLYLAYCGLHEDDCAALLQSLLGCINLESINLSGNTIGKATKHLVEVIHKLSSYGNLRKLYLSGCSFPEDQCAVILKSLSLCKQLTCLLLSNNRIPNAGKYLADSIKQWGVNSPLKVLGLRNCGLHEDDCAELLQSLLGCINLVGIDLSGNTIGKAVKHLVELIQTLSSYGKLEKLYLYDCSFPEDHCAAILKSLSSCKQLTILDLSNNKIQNAGKDLADSIKQWGVNPPLQVLDLRNCGLHEDDCAELLQSLLGCVNLVQIDLSENNIGKASTYLIEIIRNFRHLQKLYLSKSSISEQGWGEIFNSLGTCNNLTYIDLSENTVGESASQLAGSIRQWGDNPPLQQLGLRNCSIPEQCWGEILNSLGTCNNLTHIDLSENTVGESASQLAGSIRQWGDNPPLQQLGLRNCSIPEQCWGEILNSLGTCNNLTHIDLSENTVEESASKLAQSIRQWGDNPPLQLLGLGNCSIPKQYWSEILKSLGTCNNLTHIGLSFNTVGKSAHQLAQSIRQWGDNPPLQKLGLGNCSIPEQYWSEIFYSLGTCNNLTHIDLSKNTVGGSASQLAQSIRQWGDNPPLQVLHLYDCSIPEDACCELISALFSCKRLAILELAGSHLREKGLHLKRYLETITDTLEALGLGGCFIPVDITRQIISVLSRCKNLYHINLLGNTLTGQISRFVPHPQLKHLDLSYAALNKVDIDHLTDIILENKVPNLEELFLNGNSLDSLKKETKLLLDTCIKYHPNKLTVCLYRNNLTEELLFSTHQ